MLFDQMSIILSAALQVTFYAKTLELAKPQSIRAHQISLFSNAHGTTCRLGDSPRNLNEKTITMILTLWPTPLRTSPPIQ